MQNVKRIQYQTARSLLNYSVSRDVVCNQIEQTIGVFVTSEPEHSAFVGRHGVERRAGLSGARSRGSRLSCTSQDLLHELLTSGCNGANDAQHNTNLHAEVNLTSERGLVARAGGDGSRLHVGIA